MRNAPSVQSSRASGHSRYPPQCGGRGTVAPSRAVSSATRASSTERAASGRLCALAQAPIIQPGPPGSPVRDLSADEAARIADTSYSPADVRFMQDMIPHHQQALEMAALVGERTNRQEIVDAAGRIDASQQDEIGFMRDAHPESEVAVWCSIAAAWLAYHEKYLNDETLPDAEEKKIVAALIGISTGVEDVGKLGVPAEVGQRLIECYDSLGKE